MARETRRLALITATLGLIGCSGWWIAHALAEEDDPSASSGHERLRRAATSRDAAGTLADAPARGAREALSERQSASADGRPGDTDAREPGDSPAPGDAAGDAEARAGDGAGAAAQVVGPDSGDASAPRDSAADDAKEEDDDEEEEEKRGVVIMGGLVRAMDGASRPSGGSGGDNDVEEEAPRCGDGVTDEDADEECDDGNDDKYDGCESNCLRTGALEVDGGLHHTCALLTSGDVKCWGENSRGQLGLGDTDDEHAPEDVPPIELGGAATSIAVAVETSCALLEGGDVRCWGAGDEGQLGYGDAEDVGDDKVPADVGSVALGGPAKQICALGRATCAVMKDGAVRCWGTHHSGRNGLGVGQVIGDDELPVDAPPVDVGGPVAKLHCGEAHVCALLESREIVCWGDSDQGRNGHPGHEDIGDDETPASVGVVNIGGTPIDIAGGSASTCVTLEGGHLRCFGGAPEGQLGYGTTEHFGDDEAPAKAPIVDTGGRKVLMMTGSGHSCLLLEGGALRCYGHNDAGQLGLGNTEALVARPADAPDVEVGATVTRAGVGNYHTCVVTEARAVRCWGRGSHGRLGYGGTGDLGDTPGSVPRLNGDIPLL